MIESPAFVGALTGRDNLRSLAMLRGLPHDRVNQVLKTVGLVGRADDKASTYSLGMKQRLGIAAALLPDPELLVLDEPTNGLDPAGIVEIRQLLRSLADDGRTVVVSSHLLTEIQAMVDSLVVIRFGELVYSGSLDDLLLHGSERVVAAPELPSELPQLIALVEANVWPYETSADHVIVDIPADRSPELFRAADSAGLTLRMLNPESDTLETIFLRMTGATDAELSEQRRKQRHGDDG